MYDPDDDDQTDNSIYRATYTFSIATTDDTEAERTNESFSVILTKVTTGTDPTNPNITLCGATQTITISPSDLNKNADLSELSISATGLDDDVTITRVAGTTSYTATATRHDNAKQIEWLHATDDSMVFGMPITSRIATRQYSSLSYGENTVRIRVTVTATNDEQPHEGSGPLQLTT